MRGLFLWALFAAAAAALAAVVLLVSLVPLAGSAGTASPAAITVTTTGPGDDALAGDGACLSPGGGCTLTAAVQEAAASGVRRIRLPASTYDLEHELRLTGVLTIEGAPNAIVTGERIVIEEGATVTISDVTVRDIHTTYPGSDCGAGIHNMGTLHLIRVDVINNTNRNPGGGICNTGNLTAVDGEITHNGSVFTGNGGGLYNTGNAALTEITMRENYTNGASTGAGGGGIRNYGTLTLLRVQVEDNSDDGGGAGLYNSGSATVDSSVFDGNHSYSLPGKPCCIAEGAGLYNGGTLVMRSTTVSGNTANGGPGGIANDGEATIEASTISGNGYGGVSNSGTMSMVNSTVSGNYGGVFPDVIGWGGVFNTGTLDLSSTTITGNTPTYMTTGGIINSPPGTTTIGNTIVAANGGDNCAGDITSRGHNLSSDISCVFTANGDTQDTPALLGPLGSYGGLTQTHSLQPGSPAIDAGDNAQCPGTDQRGAGRPVNGVCDVGSYEFGGDLPAPSPTPTPTATPAPPSRVDVNCDGQITAADAQIILRYVVGLPFTIPQSCPALGTILPLTTGTTHPTITGTPLRESPSWPLYQGDADCLGGVNATDALVVLRLIAQLPFPLPGGCPPL